MTVIRYSCIFESLILVTLLPQATECATAASVTVRAAGRDTIATAVRVPRPARQRMALSAAVAGDASVATACAPYPEHPGTGVKSAPHVETLATLQGEKALAASVCESKCNVMGFVSHCGSLRRKI